MRTRANGKGQGPTREDEGQRERTRANERGQGRGGQIMANEGGHWPTREVEGQTREDEGQRGRMRSNEGR